jgi:hypothetical protein
LSALSVARQANGDMVVTWSGAGTLQSAASLVGPNNWTDVTPAPAGNSHTIPSAAQAAATYYRLRQ